MNCEHTDTTASATFISFPVRISFYRKISSKYIRMFIMNGIFLLCKELLCKDCALSNVKEYVQNRLKTSLIFVATKN